jgi:ParB-like chromosome segregation protein Spo0J
VHSRKQIAQLAKSIEKFGIVVPILVKREDVGGVSIGFRTTKQKGGAL